MLIRPVAEQTFHRAALRAAGLVCVGFGREQSAGHLAPKFGKIEYFRADTIVDSRQLGNPDEGT